MPVPTAPASVDELVAAVARDGVEFVLCMFVDMHGKPCAKLVPAAALAEIATNGAGFAGFAAGPLGQSPADPDILAIPDPSSYTVLPWKPELAAVQCDPTVEGQLWPFAPRVILRRQLDLLAERNMTLMCGAEAEYFLVRRNPDGSISVADGKDTAANPCYDARGLLRMYDHLSTVSRHLNTLGWGNYANDHEDANGQFEQNFKYADAMATADRLILFRYLVHSLAEEAGMEATFMPKPFSHLTGSGLHVHLSLWSDGEGALRRSRRSGRSRHVVDGLQLHRRAHGPRPGGRCRDLPDGQLLQADGRRRPQLRGHVGAVVCRLRGQQPHPHAADPRARPGGEPRRGR